MTIGQWAPHRRGCSTPSPSSSSSVSPSHDLPARGLVSAVTIAELSVGPRLGVDEEEREVRLRRLQAVEAGFEVLVCESGPAASGAVSASLRRSGQATSARAFDALIAATALANGLAVYTCNAADFAGIDGLKVVAVTHPDQSS